MTKLEITPTQWEEVKKSDYVLIFKWVRSRDDQVTRQWVEASGTKEKCEASVGGRGLFVVPSGLLLEYQIAHRSQLIPPEDE